MKLAFLSVAPPPFCAHPNYHTVDRRPRRPKQTHLYTGNTACAIPPPDAISAEAGKDSPLLPQSEFPGILDGTMLADEPLALAFTTIRHGFDNEAFFDKMIPLGGVPSLVLGRTSAGVLFGGYTAYGFLARDDYREAATERSMFVFRVAEDGAILIAGNTDPIQYDFYDYAVRLGAALLGVPMNPAKHTMKSDVGTSSCRLPNGETSVFGDSSLAKIDELQVWVAKRYVDDVNAKQANPGKGFFAKLFG